MPIEIKELHISVTVDSGTSSTAAATPAASSATGQAPTNQEALIAECVEQVLQILERKKER